MEGDNSQKLRAILDTAVEAIITISSEGLIESFNRAAEKLFEYKKEEVLGRNVSMLMPAPFAGEHDGYLRNYLTTGKAKIIGIGREVIGRRNDGTQFPMKLAVSEVQLEDRIIFCGFIDDLTERKRLEQEAENWRQELENRVEVRTEALARANQELEHFAHTISHDLRTPLRGIRNYVDFLSEDLAGKLEGETAEDLERLKRATDELDRMIQDLLEYTRIGRKEAPSQSVNIRSLIDEIIQSTEKKQGQEITIKGELPELFAPVGSLRQIFQNLIENGLLYNHSELRRVEISAQCIPGVTPPRWVFSIKDNGIGIEPHFHASVFQMFKRLHTETEYSGTGIGLAAVRKAVQYLGGAVWLESEPGIGSTFFVALPEHCFPERFYL